MKIQKKERLIILTIIVVALLILILPFVLSEGVSLQNIGQLGFIDANNSFTSLRTITINTNYSDENATCAYSNDNTTWASWNFCTLQKQWLLSDGAGLKTVYAKINHSDSSISNYSATIFYNYTGAGLDTTLPTQVTIIYNQYTNSNSTISLKFTNASDPESNLLKIPLFYTYNIYLNNVLTNNSLYPDSNRITLSSDMLGFGVNYTFNESDNITIEINAINSAGLTSKTNATITIDLSAPNNTIISSPFSQATWYGNSTIFFNWSSNDELSGIAGYSYSFSEDTTVLPDDILDNNEFGEIENNLNKTFTDITTTNNGQYTFKIKAKDKAGNFGNITSYNIKIDSLPPSKPTLLSSDKIYNSNIINFTWSESFDYESGIANYTIEISNTSNFNETIDWIINYTVSNNTFYYDFDPTSYPYNFSNYYARIKANDKVENPSQYSNEETHYDITAPIITIIKPKTAFDNVDYDSTPIIAITTNEKAVCYYNKTSSGVFKEFIFTNSTYHETIADDSTDSNYNLFCDDIYGNRKSGTTISIDHDDSSSATLDADLSIPATVYQNEIISIGISVAPAKGEISKNRFKTFIDGKTVDFTIYDNSSGVYILNIKAPQKIGEYNLSISLDGVSQNTTLTISPLTLSATYTLNSISTSNFSRIVYHEIGGFKAGFGSDSTNAIVNKDADSISITSDADGKIFIFATKKSAGLIQKEKYLENKNFLLQKNPSFGYNLIDEYMLKTSLNYPNIILSGSEELNPGSHSLLFKRIKGADKKTVLITSEISNYDQNGVRQYG